MKRLILLASLGIVGCVLSASGMVYTFVEDFDAGWSSGGMWTKEGTPNPGVPMTEFAAGDPHLDDNATRTAGGFYWEKGVSGDGSDYTSGDNEHIWMDYHMPVENGTYTYRVTVDAQLKWTNIVQPWGQGICFYMGDAAEMAYGTIPPDGVPTGPWGGYSHDGGANVGTTPLMGTKWNGADWNDGEWYSLEFTQNHEDGGNTIDVTSGEVIFRMTIRLKNNDQPSPDYRAYAIDNLKIELVPEPGSLLLLAAGLLPVLRRLRR